MNGLAQLFLLSDDVAYLNHGSFGATPKPVFEEYQRLQRALKTEPVDFLAYERTLPERHAAALAREARRRLQDRLGGPSLCPADPWLAQMAAVALPEGVDGPTLHRRMRERHAAEIPWTRFADRDWLRASIQGYNTWGDVEKLVTALEIECP